PLRNVDHAMGIAVVVEPAAGRHVLAEVHVATVRRHHRLGSILLPVPAIGELEAAATTGVVDPHLARTERARVAKVLASHDVLPVRRPRGVRNLALALARYLAQVAAVHAGRPDVLQAIPVAGE